MTTLNIELPDADDERTDPASADDHYVTATRALIVRLRQHRDVNPLVEEEGIQYGFRRNLYAMKTLALPIVVVALVGDVYWSVVTAPSAGTIVSMCVHVLLLGLWLSVITQEWVWQQGWTYAERLFESLEDDRLRIQA